MRLEKIILKNFITYKHLEYEFQNKPLLIQGRNKTDEGQESNGSGKSGIQSGIEFCITASNSRDVRDAELITRGADKASAQLIACCDIRKERIHIDWTINKKGANQLILTKQRYGEAWEEVSFSNVNDGKKYVLSWFAISRDDLFNYYIINKTRFKSFFKSSNREKVELIERFSDASIVEGIDQIDNTELQDKYNKVSAEISKLDGKVELTNANIVRENSRDFEKEVEEAKEGLVINIRDIEEDIQYLLDKNLEIKKVKIDDNKKALHREELKIQNQKSTIKVIEKEIQEKQDIVDEVRKELSKAQKIADEFKGIDKSSEIKEINKEILSSKEFSEKKEREEKEFNESKTKILTLLQNIDIKLGGKITCPSCKHEFILDGDIDELKSKEQSATLLLHKVEEKIAAIKAGNQILKESIEHFQSQINEMKQEESESLIGKNDLLKAVGSISVKVRDAETSVSRLERELRSEERELEVIQNKINLHNRIEITLKQEIEDNLNRIKNHEVHIESIKHQIKGLKPQNNKDVIKRLKEELSGLEEEKKELLKDLSIIGDEIYKRNQWANNFKQFRLHLANQSLEVIEYHCNRYLVGMKSDMRIRLDGYRELANGSIKDEITTKIIRGEECSFTSFSGGEQGRLLFASILANRHMINSVHPYGGLDFLSIDEVFEGVDAAGLKALVQSAKELQIAVMIITHVTDEQVNDDILMIEKVNGVSNIVSA